MRVAVVHWGWLSYSETFIRDHLRSRDTVFIEGQPPRIVTQPRAAQPSVWHFFRRFFARFFWERAGSLLRWRYVRLFRESQVDVVLAEYGPSGVLCWPACQALQIPLIVHFHGFDATSRPCLKRFARSYPAVLGRASAVIVVSEPMRDAVLGMGAHQGNLEIIPCGVDCELIRACLPASNGPELLFVGRFVAKKAPDSLIRAFASVLKRVPRARLVMVGEGELLQSCRQLSGKLGLQDSITFLGALSHCEVLARMQRARALVLFSQTSPDGNSEGSPVTLMEAGASGLPSVSTYHAGIPEIIKHEETGLLGSPGDIDKFTANCVRLLLDGELAGRFGARARQHIEQNYSRNLTNARLEMVLRKAARSSAS